MIALKVCSECHVPQECANFAIDRTKRDNLNARCFGCKRFHDNYTERLKALFPKPNDGVCTSCHRHCKLEIDHCHYLAEHSRGIDPSAFRGWVCRSCNNLRKRQTVRSYRGENIVFE